MACFCVIRAVPLLKESYVQVKAQIHVGAHRDQKENTA
jgi:hypothetical protein